MFLPIQEFELFAFFHYLKGDFCKIQRENLLLLFVCCPSERRRLLQQFLNTYHANHRFKAFAKYFKSLNLGV